MTTTNLTDALPNNNIRGVITAFYATTAALPACTYANGSSGVGATLTGNANGALAAQDGVTPAASDIILVKNQATGAQNGVYIVTTLGDGSNPFVLTRIAAANAASKLGQVFVQVATGTKNAGLIFRCNTLASGITVGTTALTFADQRQSAFFGSWGALGAAASTSIRWLFSGAHSTAQTSASEALSVITVPGTGTLTAMVVTSDVALTTDDVAHTLRVNAVDTAITCTLLHNTKVASITGQSVAVVLGDKVTIKTVQTSTEASAASAPRASVLWVPS